MNETTAPHTQTQKALVGSLIILIGSGLYASSLYNYVLFHSLVETFCVLIMFVIFVLAWNSRRVLDNHYLLFLGVGALFSGALELIHSLAYKGLGVFSGYDANLPTQLWIAFRYVFSISFLVAPCFITRRLRVPAALITYFIVTSLIFASIFLGVFPDCFIEGRGLTTFKVVSEYVIIFIFLVSLFPLLLKRAAFDRRVLRLMVYSTLSSVASELSFTQYVSVYGLSNLVGHLFLLAAVYLIYEAIVVTGIVEPSRLLFRDLKLSEERAGKSEMQYRALFENMINGFAYHEIVRDPSGKPVDYIFLEVNRAFEHLTGLKRVNILGRKATEVLPGIEKDTADWIGTYGKVALTGMGARFEQHTETLGKWYAVSAYSPMNGYFVTVFEDITGRKAAEESIRVLNEDLVQRNRELESVNSELEAFIYSVSHDLRAPLRTMAGFAKILAEDHSGQLDEQGRDYLARISRGAAKMTRLIAELMDLSRLSKQEMCLTEVDMSGLARGIVSGLRETAPDRRAQIVIEDGLKAYADKPLMEIALSNLLENAWKFTSKTCDARIEFGVKKESGEERQASGEGSLARPTMPDALPIGPDARRTTHDVFYVRDNGAGFNPEYAGKMFRPFERLHSAEEFPGTGIGLAIVERVITRHGGRTWAESDVGKGAVIYFSLE